MIEHHPIEYRIDDIPYSPCKDQRDTGDKAKGIILFHQLIQEITEKSDSYNTEFRLKQLQEAITADPVGRVASVKPIIDELDKRADAMCLAERLHREGKLPKRICHCDTKVNNMMFD